MGANTKGKKTEPQLNNTQKVRELEKAAQQLQMATRVNQMMLQQTLQNIQGLAQDLGKAYGIINDLQYKIRAMEKVGTFDAKALAAAADEFRLTDFVEASDAEDTKGGFTIGTEVTGDSTVIITSTTPGEDRGIFRSRIELASCGVPALVEGLAGKTVGAKLTCQLNGLEHEVELLAIRNPPPPAEPKVDEAVATAQDTVH